MPQDQTRSRGERAQPELSERSRLQASAIYEVIRRDGESELERPAGSLWWSGVAAGLGISMSLVAEGALRHHLPAGPWRHAIESLGYTIGFLIVVIGRLQLFTENTITAVLPLFARLRLVTLGKTARLWGVVFAANMTGCALAVFISVALGLATPEQIAVYTSIARPLLDLSWVDTVQRGVPAGFLVATMVWLLPNARGFEGLVVILLTWLIALAGYTHVVVGATEMFHLLAVGEAGFGAVLRHISGAFVGNVLGGTGLFALLAYGQVKQEM